MEGKFIILYSGNMGITANALKFVEDMGDSKGDVKEAILKRR
jgi:hypothetical protein